MEKANNGLKGPAVPEKVSQNINEVHAESLTFGMRAADTLAKQAGSWRFIFGFAAVLIVWIALNSLAYIRNWDPYPFILLNLLLSCLAAIQAPVIMMSQNRHEAHDRLKADADYAINVKAEAELERLHDKIDQLNGERVRDLLTMQKEQMEMLHLLVGEKGGNTPAAI